MENPAEAGAAKTVVARLSSIRTDRDVSKGTLVIVCRQPGLRRAGVVHPAVETYGMRKFGKLQLAELRAEPLLELIEIL